MPTKYVELVIGSSHFNFFVLADISGYCGVSGCPRRNAWQHWNTGILFSFHI